MLIENKTMVKFKSDFILTIGQKPEKKITPLKFKNKTNCPICDGKGQRMDRILHRLRPCVGCNGTGNIKYHPVLEKL
jgi:DnaJ-class molecular chaperone